MLESIFTAFPSLTTTAKAIEVFDAFRKGRKGDVRSLIEELKENSRLCFHVVNEGIDHKTVISKFSTSEFDRLNKAGFNFNVLKSQKIQTIPGIEKSDLASWPGKKTAALVENIYDKIKDLKSLHEFKPEGIGNRRLLINIHKRILLLLRHAQG
ncbi:MAG: hypothetical protein Q8M91_18820 [Polaromonas sp.]|uniref:hypothetical protein n=1 Tax=Nitrosomonas sp. TaxID=42353 RepID=UPI002732130A|nr:hypothetical protein [Nitrosomonas sp.]MDP1788006.1 hypothetical protein [Nitrosomonas sp.]MDP2224362.1 hypothetical protein [Nitrosomonas sp.]MDP3172386.1 hypothetical protein [Polaromonas sp.]